MRHSLRPLRSLVGLLAVFILWSAWPVATAAPVPPDSPSPSSEAPPSSAAPAPIVGGQPADIDDYPWTVYLTDASGLQFCGGTLAKANKVITAAHCVVGKTPDSFRVVAGRQDKQSIAGTVVGVTRLWIHPDFQSPFRGADVAVLTLDTQLQQRPLPPASQQDSGLYQAGTPATVLGWGATTEGGSTSRILRKAEVPLISNANCSEAYPSRYSPETMVCAGLPEGGVDSCQGDSGGPLVVDGKLIGIVSWGKGCARPGNPGVYTRVATYYQDIRQQLGANV